MKLIDLPPEIILEISKTLQPKSIFALRNVHKYLRVHNERELKLYRVIYQLKKYGINNFNGIKDKLVAIQFLNEKYKNNLNLKSQINNYVLEISESFEIYNFIDSNKYIDNVFKKSCSNLTIDNVNIGLSILKNKITYIKNKCTLTNSLILLTCSIVNKYSQGLNIYNKLFFKSIELLEELTKKVPRIKSSVLCKSISFPKLFYIFLNNKNIHKINKVCMHHCLYVLTNSESHYDLFKYLIEIMGPDHEYSEELYTNCAQYGSLNKFKLLYQYIHQFDMDNDVKLEIIELSAKNSSIEIFKFLLNYNSLKYQDIIDLLHYTLVNKYHDHVKIILSYVKIDDFIANRLTHFHYFYHL